MGTKLKADGTTVTTKSVSETGHAKNAAAFADILTGLADFGPKYQPGNDQLQLWNLGQKKEQVDKAMDAWGTADQDYDDAENERTKAFSGLGAYCTRIVNTLISSKNISELTIKDARSINTKIQGARSAKSKKNNEEAKLAGDDQPRTISVSQQSYDQKLAHFTALRKLVAAQPTYLPNEEDLKLSGLEAYQAKLKAANNNIIIARSKLIDARNNRNLELYHEETGVIALSKAIKSYVKSIFGATHPNFRKISGISFKAVKDRASSLK
jgi:hypothetical protein